MEQELKGSLDNNNEHTHKGLSQAREGILDYSEGITLPNETKLNKTQNKEQ